MYVGKCNYVSATGLTHNCRLSTTHTHTTRPLWDRQFLVFPDDLRSFHFPIPRGKNVAREGRSVYFTQGTVSLENIRGCIPRRVSLLRFLVGFYILVPETISDLSAMCFFHTLGHPLIYPRPENDVDSAGPRTS